MAKEEPSFARFRSKTIHLRCASHIGIVAGVSKQKEPRALRSGCPVSIALDIFGDRWSLLIIRDMMVRGYRSFKEFLASGESIATNVLADRLRQLQIAGIIEVEPDPADGRKLSYRLTEKGIDLAPILLELLIWAARHEETAAPCNLIANMAENREQMLGEVRKRWKEHDSTPLLPKFPALSRTQRHRIGARRSGLRRAR